MLALIVRAQVAVLATAHRSCRAPGAQARAAVARPDGGRTRVGLASGGRVGGDRGQATAEYALVLLGAAAVALLLLAWATRTKAIGELLDLIVEQIVGRVK